MVALDDLVGDAGVGPAEIIGRVDPGPENETATVSGGRRSRRWSCRVRGAHSTSSVEASQDLRDGCLLYSSVQRARCATFGVRSVRSSKSAAPSGTAAAIKAASSLGAALSQPAGCVAARERTAAVADGRGPARRFGGRYWFGLSPEAAAWAMASSRSSIGMRSWPTSSKRAAISSGVHRPSVFMSRTSAGWFHTAMVPPLAV